MFDPSAPHIIILLVVVLLLFGASRLPGAAKSLGSAMRIFRKEMKGLDGEETPPTAHIVDRQLPSASAQPASTDHEQRVDELQRQVDELRKQSVGSEASREQF